MFTGMAPVLQSEDAMAAVLGHEVCLSSVGSGWMRTDGSRPCATDWAPSGATRSREAGLHVPPHVCGFDHERALPNPDGGYAAV